jgi:hypothetical protein
VAGIASERRLSATIKEEPERLRKGGGGLPVSAEDVCGQKYQGKAEEWSEQSNLERSVASRKKSKRWESDYRRNVDQYRDQRHLHASSVAIAV